MAMFGMSDDMKAQLIQEIQKRPLIWKVSDPKYTDVPSRWLAFEEIAHELSDSYMTFSSDMIKIAWKNMMDYYNQIRRRHDRAMIAGTPFTKPKWQFYEIMHFVRQDKPAVKRKYNWIEPSKKDYEEVVGDRNIVREKTLCGSAPYSEPHSRSVVSENNRARNAKRQQEDVSKSVPAIKVTEREGSSKGTLGSRSTPRREGLRQAPRKSLWLVKKEYVTDEAEEWDAEPARKVAKRPQLTSSPAKLQRGRTQSHKNETDNFSPVLKQVPPTNEILSSIDANATEPLSNMDSALAFGRQLVARLNALPASNYRSACREIEKIVAKFEALTDKTKGRKVVVN
ncbi:unnamed protein product [Enterobius vermicularis]|uniref:MADF domain-containing protein n=1 Tax=Enterobius vermicularis TaxID=51028 RepID=A0A0N4UVK5_ENTVE|nr:unnamed protein product [Enterobius vermicularis]